jgi:hypothetical protein
MGYGSIGKRRWVRQTSSTSASSRHSPLLYFVHGFITSITQMLGIGGTFGRPSNRLAKTKQILAMLFYLLTSSCKRRIQAVTWYQVRGSLQRALPFFTTSTSVTTSKTKKKEKKKTSHFCLAATNLSAYYLWPFKYCVSLCLGLPRFLPPRDTF